jgi:hypothetical protein
MSIGTRTLVFADKANHASRLVGSDSIGSLGRHITAPDSPHLLLPASAGCMPRPLDKSQRGGVIGLGPGDRGLLLGRW